MVWFKPAGDGRRATDFRVQQYDGRPVLTWWQGLVGFGNGAGDGIVMDANYKQIARVRAGNDWATDLHEFVITPQGTALVLIYQPMRRNLHSIGRSRNGLVVDNIVQEIDIKTGLVLFEWHSIGQVRLGESEIPPPPRRESAKEPYDYFHVNSVDLDRDGNVLISARNTSGVYKLSRATGAILWRLGGKRSDFDMGPGTRFKWQHDARRQADGTLTIYDNGAAPPVRKRSRAIRLRLDDQARKATLVRALAHPGSLLSASQGSAQDLPDGSVFVGWGSQRFFTEFGADGQVCSRARSPRAPTTTARTASRGPGGRGRRRRWRPRARAERHRLRELERRHRGRALGGAGGFLGRRSSRSRRFEDGLRDRDPDPGRREALRRARARRLRAGARDLAAGPAALSRAERCRTAAAAPARRRWAPIPLLGWPPGATGGAPRRAS